MRVAALSPVLLLAFALALSSLKADPIWTDELYSLSNIGAFDPPFSPADIIASLVEYSPQHTPLYYFIAALWAQLAGWSPFALRLLSLFAGVLFIAWIYRLGTDLFCHRIAWVAAYLIATSAFVLLHFHEIRMYSLLLSLGAMHCCSYFRLAYGKPQPKSTWLLFIASAIALLYTHIFSSLLFAALLTLHCLTLLRQGRAWKIVLAWLAALACFLVYVPVVYAGFLEETTKPSTVSAAFSTEEMLHAIATLLGNGSSYFLLGIAALALLQLLHSRSAPGFRIAALAGILLLIMLAVNGRFQLIGIYRSRYLLPLWIPCTLLIAYTMASRGKWLPLSLLLLGIWTVLGFQFQRSSQMNDYVGGMIFARYYPPMHEYVQALRGKTQPEDFLLGFTVSDYVNQPRKHGKSPSDYYTQALLQIDGAFIPSKLTGQALQDALEQKRENNPFLLLAYNPQHPPTNLQELRSLLTPQYQQCTTVLSLDWLVVQRLHALPIGCEHEYQPIAFENGIQLVDRFAAYDSHKQIVQVWAAWEVPEPALLDQYNVSIQIHALDGSRHWQKDQHLYELMPKWQYVVAPTSQLAPGQYRVAVILYDRYDGSKAAGIDLQTGASAKIHSIFAFTRER